MQGVKLRLGRPILPSLDFFDFTLMMWLRLDYPEQKEADSVPEFNLVRMGETNALWCKLNTKDEMTRSVECGTTLAKTDNGGGSLPSIQSLELELPDKLI